jgi:hypothetical protein
MPMERVVLGGCWLLPNSPVEADGLIYRFLIRKPLFFSRMALLNSIAALLFFSNKIAIMRCGTATSREIRAN